MTKQNSFAKEMLEDLKKQNKRLFIIWIVTFVAFIGLLGYTIYLLNDIEVITKTETTEYNQDIDTDGTIDNSFIINGGDYNG